MSKDPLREIARKIQESQRRRGKALAGAPYNALQGKIEFYTDPEGRIRPKIGRSKSHKKPSPNFKIIRRMLKRSRKQ